MGAVEEEWWDTVTHNRQQLEYEEQGIKSTCTIRRLKPLHITECILV